MRSIVPEARETPFHWDYAMIPSGPTVLTPIELQVLHLNWNPFSKSFNIMHSIWEIQLFFFKKYNCFLHSCIGCIEKSIKRTHAISLGNAQSWKNAVFFVLYVQSNVAKNVVSTSYFKYVLKESKSNVYLKFEPHLALRELGCTHHRC